jgi:rubrerythrin
MDARDILNAAIDDECAAYELYASTASRTDEPAARELLLELAEEEKRHRELLEEVQPALADAFQPESRPDMKLSDHLQERPLSEDSDLQDVVIYAMHREQQARDFYARMSLAMPDRDLSRLFHNLSVMENAHKARLEEFYEQAFLRES